MIAHHGDGISGINHVAHYVQRLADLGSVVNEIAHKGHLALFRVLVNAKLA